MSNYLIELNDVTVSYQDSKTRSVVCVLGQIRLKIREREFLTVVGPSGCGKSTMLNLIAGIRKVDSGEALIDGRPINRVGKDRGIVFQNYSVFPHLTVIENIAAGLIAQESNLITRSLYFGWFQKARKQAIELAKEYAFKVGLKESDFRKYPTELSGGMNQRVAIAQAMITHPRILLMDEPFSALDAAVRRDMQILMLKRFEETNTTVIFVTHDLDEAIFLGTRVIALSQYYNPDELVESKVGEESNAIDVPKELTDTKSERQPPPHNFGAKIVCDKHLPGPHPRPTSWLETEPAKTLRNRIYRDAIEKTYRQRISEFDHDHQDSSRKKVTTGTDT